MELQYTRTVH